MRRWQPLLYVEHKERWTAGDERIGESGSSKWRCDAMRLGEELQNKNGGGANKGGLDCKQTEQPPSAAEEKKAVAKKDGVAATTRYSD